MSANRDIPEPGSLRARVVDYVWANGPVTLEQVRAAFPGERVDLPACERRQWIERIAHGLYDRPESRAAEPRPAPRGPGRPPRTTERARPRCADMTDAEYAPVLALADAERISRAEAVRRLLADGARVRGLAP